MAAVRWSAAGSGAKDFAAARRPGITYLPADGEDPDWLRSSYAIYDHVTVNSAGRTQNYQDPSSQMQNRPVAASEWVILLDNSRQFGVYLNFDLLEDVEILISFRRNAPTPIW